MRLKITFLFIIASKKSYWSTKRWVRETLNLIKLKTFQFNPNTLSLYKISRIAKEVLINSIKTNLYQTTVKTKQKNKNSIKYKNKDPVKMETLIIIDYMILTIVNTKTLKLKKVKIKKSQLRNSSDSHLHRLRKFCFKNIIKLLIMGNKVYNHQENKYKKIQINYFIKHMTNMINQKKIDNDKQFWI